MNSLLQQLGGSIGIAVFGVLHQFIYFHYLDKEYQAPLAEHFACRMAFCVGGSDRISVDTRDSTTGPATIRLRKSGLMMNILTFWPHGREIKFF